MPTKAAKDRDMYVVKDNRLIQKSRFSLSIQAQRCLLYAISRIKFSDVPTTEYTFKISDLCESCGIELETHGDHYSRIKTELKSLRDNSIWIKRDDGKEETISWFSKVKINHGEGSVTVKFDESIHEYLFLLQSRYTQYRLETPLSFKSKYSVRLYELLLSYTKKDQIDVGIEQQLEFDPHELRKLLDGENYTKFYDFRRYVTDTACKEINAYSEDIHVEPDYIYVGKQLKKILFYVTAPRAKQVMTAREGRKKRLAPR